MDLISYEKIKGISYTFVQHYNENYRQAHHKLNTQYSTVITEIDSLFDETRIILKDDIAPLIINLVIESMDLTKTDQATVKQWINDSTIILKWVPYGTGNGVRLPNINWAIKDAIAHDNEVLQLEINISGLHFKPNFNPRNLSEFGSNQFTSDNPSTPDVRTAEADPHTPITCADLATLIAAISPQGTARSATTPLGGSQSQLTGTQVNPASLPPDVRARLKQGEAHDTYLTRQERHSFLTSTSNLSIDPSGNTMRKAFHFMDGPNRLITRSGDLFYFSKWDEKQQKTFISRCPKPASKTHDPSTIRDWYYKFHSHAKSFGIYVHNYFDFRQLSGDPKGFTCGDDTGAQLYDVPLLLESRLRIRASSIHAALQDIFSTAGTAEYRAVQLKHGRGYEALFDIIRPNHPEYHTYPSLLIKNRPEQQERQSISDFFNDYVNYLKLSSYLGHVSVNLNDDRERETFIGSLRQGREFLDKTYDERNSNDPIKQSMYKQGNLVGTLESVSKRIRPIRSLTQPHGSPVPRKELTFNRSAVRRRPNAGRPTPPTPKSVTSKKIQSVEVFSESDPTNVHVPDDLNDAFGPIVDCYINAITSGTTFDTTRPCAVCNKAGHTFDDCPVLQNVEFLCKHYIQFKLFLKKQETQSAMPAATVKQVSIDALDDIDPDYSVEEIPYTEDFLQGRE